MGYTHYWYRTRNLPKKAWDAFLNDFRQMFIALPTETASAGGYYGKERLSIAGWDGTGKPEIKSNSIRFNGGGRGTNGEDLSHETFVLQRNFMPQDWERVKENGLWFAFCKTARKPYDLLVVATLCAAKYRFREDFRLSSDGDADELRDGFNFWMKVCKPDGLPRLEDWLEEGD